MCLGIPMKLTELSSDGSAVAGMDGTSTSVDVSLIDVPQVGDYVIVHAGFAIEKLDVQEAEERIQMFEELAALHSS